MSKQEKLGLVLGSGAARGWVHVGVLRALKELDVEVGVIAGCSAGALVGGAHLLGILEDLEKWARELGPLGALREFRVNFTQAGMVNPDAAFDAFRSADKRIEDLSIPLGICATDLATGEELSITKGSVLDAARASSAIPMIFQAAQIPELYGSKWLVDGALTNPVPVDLALRLGATKTIAVDVNAQARTLDRFDSPEGKALVPSGKVKPPAISIRDKFTDLVQQTQNYVSEQVTAAKARLNAKPHFIETAIASIDIYQAHLSRAKLEIHKPDILIAPDTRALPPTAFDKPDELIELGYLAVMEQKEAIKAL